MDAEQLSIARPKNYPKEPPRYKNEIDFAEEERNLSREDKIDRDKKDKRNY